MAARPESDVRRLLSVVCVHLQMPKPLPYTTGEVRQMTIPDATEIVAELERLLPDWKEMEPGR